MASHFDLANRPDDWMGRAGFLALTVGLALFMAGLFILLPLLPRRIPNAWINLPHKEHWLAPERRERSLQRVSSSLLVMGCATQVLLLGVSHAVFTFNAVPASEGAAPARLTLPLPFAALMIGYFVVIGGVMAWMLVHFRKPAWRSVERAGSARRAPVFRDSLRVCGRSRQSPSHGG